MPARRSVAAVTPSARIAEKATSAARRPPPLRFCDPVLSRIPLSVSTGRAVAVGSAASITVGILTSSFGRPAVEPVSRSTR